MPKLTPKELFKYVVIALLAAIIVGYVIVCIFFLVIGIVADNTDFFSLGIGGLGLPILIPTIIGDIKDIFF